VVSFFDVTNRLLNYQKPDYHNHPAPILQNQIKEEITEKTKRNRKQTQKKLHKKTEMNRK